MPRARRGSHYFRNAKAVGSIQLSAPDTARLAAMRAFFILAWANTGLTSGRKAIFFLYICFSHIKWRCSRIWLLSSFPLLPLQHSQSAYDSPREIGHAFFSCCFAGISGGRGLTGKTSMIQRCCLYVRGEQTERPWSAYEKAPDVSITWGW